MNSIFNGGLRLTIEFQRRDLLWVSPTPVTNPHTGEVLSLPIRLSQTVAVSPNVLDILKRENAVVLQEVEVSAVDGTKQTMTVPLEKLVWRKRSPHEFFPQKTEEEAEEHPLHKSLSTGGTIVTEQGDFIAVQKRSSVSINALVFRLAVGMTGSEGAATSYIGDLAVDAWERDLDRAVKLYDLISQAQSGYVLIVLSRVWCSIPSFWAISRESTTKTPSRSVAANSSIDITSWINV